MCSGSEAGSYLRLIDFVHHSTLGLGVIKKKGETVCPARRPAEAFRGWPPTPDPTCGASCLLCQCQKSDFKQEIGFETALEFEGRGSLRRLFAAGLPPLIPRVVRPVRWGVAVMRLNLFVSVSEIRFQT